MIVGDFDRYFKVVDTTQGPWPTRVALTMSLSLMHPSLLVDQRHQD